jgi:ClpP protease-like protein
VERRATRLRMRVAGKTPEPPNRRRLSVWLQENLFERRIVLVNGRLDADRAAQAAAALMALDAIGEEPIELHLDSADGTLESAFVLIDTQICSTRRCASTASDRSVVRPSVLWRPPTTAQPFRTHVFDCSNPRRSSPGRQTRLRRTVGSNRSCSGGSMPVSPTARAGLPRRSPTICGAGVTSTPRKHSPTASSMRSAAPAKTG